MDIFRDFHFSFSKKIDAFYYINRKKIEIEVAAFADDVIYFFLKAK